MHYGIIFLVALAVRLLYLLDIRHTPLLQVLLIDSDTYDRLARLILAGKFHGEEVYAMNPLYPYFLAGVYAVGGGAKLTVLAAQAVLDAGSSAMIAWLGWRFFGRGTALLAGFAAALYGPFVFYTGALLTPTLILFLLLVAVVLLAEWKVGRRGWVVFGAGVLLGLAALGRGGNALLVPLLLVFFRVETGNWRRALRPWATLTVGAALVIGGATARNYAVERKLVPISANVAAFYIGHNDEATGLYQMPSFTSGAAFQDEVWGTRDALSKRLGRPLTLAESSSWMVREGLSFAVHHPFAEARLLGLKFYYFWNRTEAATNLSYYFARDYSRWLRGLFLDFGIVAPLGLLGMVLNRRRWREHVLFYLLVTATLLVALFFFVSAEYRLPAVPALLLFAANAPVVLWGWVRGPFRWDRPARAGRRDAQAAVAMMRTLRGNLVIAAIWFLVFAIFCNVRNERLRYQSLKRVDYLNFGMLYKNLGDYPHAELMLRHSLAIDPRYAPAYETLAEVAHKQGNELEAARLSAEARQYQEAPAGKVSTAPAGNLADSVLAAGELYQAKRYPEAMERFLALRARAEQAGDPALARSMRNNIGLCRFQMGELDSAGAIFSALMAEDSTYVKAINNLGKVRAAEGRRAEAAALFKKVLAVEPQNRIAREELARLQK
jgi:tetratricopeptide (TPR) repeat protein